MNCNVSNCDRLAAAKGMCKKHYNKQCYHKNKDKYCLWNKNYRNSEKGKIAVKNWDLENRKDYNKKPNCKKSKKEWAQRNFRYHSAYNFYYNLKKEQACPKWINFKDLQAFYENCPEGMTVDHIIPLHNENVSGLHVPWNLQYLTRSDNSSKSNKFDFTYENDSWKKENKR